MGKETEQKQEIVNQGVHTYSQEEAYVWPEEPVLRKQLEWFQDQKLALMVHWGVYNQLGMVRAGHLAMRMRSGPERRWTGRMTGRFLRGNTEH